MVVVAVAARRAVVWRAMPVDLTLSVKEITHPILGHVA